MTFTLLLRLVAVAALAPQQQHGLRTTTITRRVVLGAPAVVLAPVQQARGAESFDSDVQVLRNGRRAVWLIGTAHVSDVSARLVSATIDDVGPDLIMVELDAKRVAKFRQNERPQNATFWPSSLEDLAARVVGEALRLLYKGFDELGFESGAEFATALDRASARQIPVLLADRDVDVTLRRVAEALRRTDPEDLTKLDETLVEILKGEPSFTKLADDLTTANLRDLVEVAKQRATVRRVVDAVKVAVPDLYGALVDERDAFMTSALLATIGKDARVVAVVGMAHEDGIARRLKQAGFTDDLAATRRANAISKDQLRAQQLPSRRR